MSRLFALLLCTGCLGVYDAPEDLAVSEWDLARPDLAQAPDLRTLPDLAVPDSARAIVSGTISDPQSGGLPASTVTGHLSAPDAVAAIQVIEAPGDPARNDPAVDANWRTLVTARSATQATAEGYAFSAPLPPRTDPVWSTSWPAGALLRLRLTTVDGAMAQVVVGEPSSPPAQRYLDGKGAVAAAETRAYYAAWGAPPTLSEFRTRYGFGTAVGNEVNATYYNRADLGIGRELTCRAFASGRACYVANYGTFGGAELDAVAAAVAGRQSGTHAGSFAQVAMVYTAPDDVQFAVYGPDGALLDTAQLDVRGDNTTVPTNCLNCHGVDSEYDAVAHTVRGAKFLPLDPTLLGFADVDGFRAADQADALRRMNDHVYNAGATALTRALLESWYGGPPAASDGFRAQAIPPGFTAEPELYREVMRPFCHGCHASAGPSRDFASGEALRSLRAVVQLRVCDSSTDPVRRMPSAEVSAHAFWNSTARARLAAAANLRGSCVP